MKDGLILQPNRQRAVNVSETLPSSWKCFKNRLVVANTVDAAEPRYFVI